MNERIVSVVQSNTEVYPEAPFHPGERYAEFSHFQLFSLEINSENHVYGAVREVLIELELDKEHIGTQAWNPFRELVKKGEKVVIKPNLVFHKHPFGKEGVEAMITHASLIRPLVDYILLATEGEVEINIADAPLQNASWDELMDVSGLKSLVCFYQEKSFQVKTIDLRYEVAETNAEGIIVKRSHEHQDPLGSTAVQLGKKSALNEIVKYHKKLEITDYDPGEVAKHHNPTKNEYLISNSILSANLFINVPKLKTHKKAGLTFSLKNLIGINCDKSWIAHHRKGSPEKGGDEYREVQILSRIEFHVWSILKRYAIGVIILSLAKKVYRAVVLHGEDIGQADIKKKNRPISEGSWYGNDTVWRCIADLNNVVFYADKNGVMQESVQRKYLCIGDGIICGEKEGPVRPSPKKAGIVFGGFNPVYVDRVAAQIMGFDYLKIPQIRESFKNRFWVLAASQENQIVWKSNVKNVQDVNLHFVPSINWKNQIELK